MTAQQLRQFEMLGRVRKFGKTHQDRFVEAGGGGQAFATVSAAIDEVESFNGNKQTARRVSKQQQLLARRDLERRLRKISNVARVMAKTSPDADAMFPLPTRQSYIAVLQAGVLFLREAEPVKDDFIRSGLPVTFVDDLRKAVTALEVAIARRQDGRTDSKVSRVAIRAALRKGMDAVDSLDVFVDIVFGDDVKTMAAWKSDRHVERLPVKSTGEPAAAPVTPPAADATLAEVTADPLRRAS